MAHGRRSAALRPQLENILFTRSRSIYSAMAARAERKHIELPFTLDEFRRWLAHKYGSSGEKVVQCTYCNVWLNIQTVFLDHKTPLGSPWNGSAALDNLADSCSNCNTRKGKMSAEGFLDLVTWATAHLDSRDLGDMLGRLATGGEGAKAMWARKRPAGARRSAKPTLF